MVGTAIESIRIPDVSCGLDCEAEAELSLEREVEQANLGVGGPVATDPKVHFSA